MKKKLPFNIISRSHPYRERSHTDGLYQLFSDLKAGDVCLDPFCGAGTPAFVALQQGAGIVAGDLNPMAVLFTKALLQPVGLFALRETFEGIRGAAKDKIERRYTILCPGCRKKIQFDYLVWSRTKGKIYPDAVKVTCKTCGFDGQSRLTDSQIRRQLSLSNVLPEHWFPKKKIPAKGSTELFYIKDQFTQRNLASLADLLHVINNISIGRCRETFQSIFTAILFRCITQGISENSFDVLSFGPPPIVKNVFLEQEVNVWRVFETQFNLFLRSKKDVNSLLSSVQFSDSMDAFENSDAQAYITNSDCLSFPISRKRKLSHVFLDPPGDQGDACLRASEFQGSWLKMKVDRKLFWDTGFQSTDGNENNFKRLLQRVIQNTDSSCQIFLSRQASTKEARETLQDTVSGIGCELYEIGPLQGASPHQKKHGKLLTKNYFSIVRTNRKKRKTPLKPADKDINELYLHIRGTVFRENIESTGKIYNHILPMMRGTLKTQFLQLTKQDIARLVSDETFNQKAYNRECLALLEAILVKDGFGIGSVVRDRFDTSEVDRYIHPNDLHSHDGDLRDIDIIAENQNGQKIFFSFYDPKKEKILKKIGNRVFKQDEKNFQLVCYLIFASRSEMNSCRQVDWADNWPRGFFVCFQDLCKQAAHVKPDVFGNLVCNFSKRKNLGQKQGIKHFKAEVIQNTPVGLDGKPMHYKLEIRTPDMKNIGPGQFIMIDPLPYAQRKKMDQVYYRNVFGSGTKQSDKKNKIDLAPKSYLKRPFGVQRAYYKYFEWGYHQTLMLPPGLAAITHTVFPHKFEVFYKLIEGGIGTRELTGLKKGDQIRVLGPLGKYTHIPGWRSQDIREVHLIGGGVGMAPLVFFGQALKFYSFAIKAFIGIDRIESLAEAPYGKTFSEEPGKAYVYIEELSKIGLLPEDIYLSRESTENEQLSEKIAEDNYHCGFVTDQYRSYLKKIKNRKDLLIIACGPKPMMVVLQKIASEFSVPMKVLLEKRMGCGIGVCMSCVCRTKKNQKSQYSRVCVEGPVFDSNEIDWENL
jgi:dihydroorotate dehydrogenase electron transfer subunit